MKNYIFILIFSFTSPAFAADSKLKYLRKDIEESCIRAYDELEELQQFLYKFDGNLPEIKDSKIKNIKFTRSQLINYKISNTERKKAFSDLYNDPDYYQYKLQEQSADLIKELEKYNSESSPIKDKNLIFSLPNVSSIGDYQNPYLKIRKLLEIQGKILSFFDDLEDGSSRLEQLNQQHRLEKSLENDPVELYARKYKFKLDTVSNVIGCNLDYLEAERRGNPPSD